MNWLYDGNHLAWVGRQTGLGVCRARTATGRTLGEGSLVGITRGALYLQWGASSILCWEPAGMGERVVAAEQGFTEHLLPTHGQTSL